MTDSVRVRHIMACLHAVLAKFSVRLFVYLIFAKIIFSMDESFAKVYVNKLISNMCNTAIGITKKQAWNHGKPVA